MKTRTLKKILVGRPVEQVRDIMKMTGWILVDTNETHMVFSNGFDSIDVYIVANTAHRIV